MTILFLIFSVFQNEIDCLRFFGDTGIVFYCKSQACLIALVGLLLIFTSNPITHLLLLNISQFVFAALRFGKFPNPMTLRKPLHLIYTRMIDVLLGSGLGYFIPTLILFLLTIEDVAQLRFVQMFLGLSNFVTMGLYFRVLKDEASHKSTSKKAIYPSLIVLTAYLGINILIPQTMNDVFGNSAKGSEILLTLLAIALLPSTIGNMYLALLINVGEYKYILKLHICTSITTLLTILYTFPKFGLNSLGAITCCISLVEVFILRRKLGKLGQINAISS